MPELISLNSTANPADSLTGRGVLFGKLKVGLTSLVKLNQVAGLVPINPCESMECRQGRYMADIIADDLQFPLTVFSYPDDSSDEYKNDKNSFLFELPLKFTGFIKYYIDKDNGGTWVEEAEIKDNKYGKYYAPKIVGTTTDTTKQLCTDKNWTGVLIDWNKIDLYFGRGMYRFRVQYKPFNSGPGPNTSYCFSSPPFCLSEFLCDNANRTTKFEAYYAGGKLGNISKAVSCVSDASDYWEFCCCKQYIFKPNYVECLNRTFKALPINTDAINFSITTDTSTNPYVYLTGKYSNTSSGGGFNNGNYNNSTWIYTAPCTGEYTFGGGFYYDLQCSNPGDPNLVASAIVMFGYVYDQNNNFIKKIGLISVGSTGYIINPNCVTADPNGYVSTVLNQGDYVKVAFEVYCVGTPTYPATVTINQANQTSCGFFLCSQSSGGTYVPTDCGPLTWYDSIRIPGFFGREEKEYERNQIKYQTGIINKIRDEAIRKFKWRSFGSSADNPGNGLPFWFHDRFSVYGLMADNLLVSDYNLNNADYNLKRYCVVSDGGYSPDYKGNSRYSNVTLEFKSKKQTLARNRCCS